MLFFDIDNPSPEEIKIWMKKNDFTIDSGSSALGISKRQFARFLSGETSAKRVHSLAMQMVWLINENKMNIIDSYNVNTAVTYACAKDGEVYIYRHEEWFKVLMHEVMHSFCLDFSPVHSNVTNKLKENIKNLFPINCKLDIAESYTEFWANIINLSFISFYSLKGVTNRNSFLDYFVSRE